MSTMTTKTKKKSRAGPKARSKPRTKKLQGICSTCNHADTCMYLKGSKQPIWQCEEYDDTTPAAAKIKFEDISQPTHKPIRSSSKEKDTNKYKGLCMNCENRKTCSLPKSEGGVWHCEEYQ